MNKACLYMHTYATLYISNEWLSVSKYPTSGYRQQEAHKDLIIMKYHVVAMNDIAALYLL